MEEIKPIQNEDEYNEALMRLVTGAEYISSDQFPSLPREVQEVAHRRYDQITNEILKYQEWVRNGKSTKR